MSERYWITGVQLGMLIAMTKKFNRGQLANQIIDKQFMGNVKSSTVQDLHETRLELMKEAKEKGMSYDDYVKWEDTSSTLCEKEKKE